MSAVQYVGPNPEGRDFVVGDIHGCFDQLRSSLAAVSFDESKDRLFSVGDLVDRGLQSEESLAWLKKPWFYAVRGNHEQMAISHMSGRGGSHDMYIYNGGAWFLALTEAEQLEYIAHFRTLPVVIQLHTMTGRKIGLVHADPVFEDWNELLARIDDDRVVEAAMWSRRKITMKDPTVIENVDLIYCGHTPLKDAEILGNVHYIDTGAVFSDGKMTLLEIEQ